MKKFSFFASAWSLFLISSWCSAQTYEKNKFPCIEDICLGDEITTLQNLPWEKVDFSKSRANLKNQTVLKIYQDQFGKDFRGQISPTIVPYLALGGFDRNALQALAGITANCNSDSDRKIISGEYVSKGGNPTKVGLELTRKDLENAEQKWRVVYITRFVEVPKDQVKDVVAQLQARYKNFYRDNAQLYRPEIAMVRLDDRSNQVRYDLEYSPYFRGEMTKFPAPAECRKQINLN